MSLIGNYNRLYINLQDEFYPETVSQQYLVYIHVWANRAPKRINTISNLHHVAGVPFSYTIGSDIFEEEDGEPLTYSFYSNPDSTHWLSLDSSTGTFTGTPKANDDAVNYIIYVTADDNNTNSGSATDSFRLYTSDNQPPLLDQGLSTPTNTSIYCQFIYTLPIDAFKDPEDEDYTIRVEITNGNFILNYEPLTRIITGTPTDNTKYGTHIVKFYVEDVHNITSFTHNMNIYISENLPPVVDTAPSNAFCIIAHFPLSHTIPKSSFSEPDGETIIYIFATNETSKDAWLSMSETATDLVFTGAPTNTQHGNYTVTITLTDGHSDTGSTTTTFGI